MMNSEGNSTVKVPVDVPGLPPPWRAFIHRGKDNKKFFLNMETHQSLWEADFLKYYGHVMGTLASTGFPAGSSIGDEQVDEPMEVDEITNEISSYRETRTTTPDSLQQAGSFLDLDDLNDAVHDLYGNASLLAVFDTSALLNFTGILPSCVHRDVHCIIPYTVLRELDGLKKTNNEDLKKRVFAVHWQMDDLVSRFPDRLAFESSTDANAKLFLASFNDESIPFEAIGSDEKIIKSALQIKMRAFVIGGAETAVKVYLVSNDRNMKAKALSHELECPNAEDFMDMVVSSTLPTATSCDSLDEKQRASVSSNAPPPRGVMPRNTEFVSEPRRREPNSRRSESRNRDSRRREPNSRRSESRNREENSRSQSHRREQNSRDYHRKCSASDTSLIQKKNLSIRTSHSKKSSSESAVGRTYKPSSSKSARLASGSQGYSSSQNLKFKDSKITKPVHHTPRVLPYKDGDIEILYVKNNKLPDLRIPKKCSYGSGLANRGGSISSPSSSASVSLELPKNCTHRSNEINKKEARLAALKANLPARLAGLINSSKPDNDKLVETMAPMPAFDSETEKFIHLLKTSVHAAVGDLTVSKAGNESKQAVLDRMAASCHRFLSNGFEHVEMVAVMTLVESLYSHCIAKLSATQRVMRGRLLEEISSGGEYCMTMQAMRAFSQYMESMGWRAPAENVSGNRSIVDLAL